MKLRRVRGALLRVVRRRGLALGVGVGMLSSAIWLRLNPHSAAWWAEGVSLLFGATGVALIYTGLFGVKPDWTDPGDE